MELVPVSNHLSRIPLAVICQVSQSILDCVMADLHRTDVKNFTIKLALLIHRSLQFIEFGLLEVEPISDFFELLLVEVALFKN